MPIKSIGEMKISIAETGEEFFFKPSLSNMMELGNPKEIVEKYAIINGIEINRLITITPVNLIKHIRKITYGRRILHSAMDVLTACCKKDIDQLIGYFTAGKSGLIYQRGLMEINDIIAIAKNLLEHGIIGKANLRVAAREEDGYSDQFDAMSYITSARVNFNMSLDEAKNLTMTELHMLIKQKFPPSEGFTRHERFEIAKKYELDRAKRIAESKNRGNK